jgi:non-specific serine/threonine protein kinase
MSVHTGSDRKEWVVQQEELASRYQLVRCLGEGGMGVVHEAVDKQLDRRVAIKMLRDRQSDDPAAHERFIREARAAAAVSHPNVCHLHEIGEHEGAPFLVMELLEGEPLSARLSRGRLSVAEALDVMLPVLGALGVLHETGIVHRDLKPSNVFLTPHGVKLLDFGLARHSSIDMAFTAPDLTRPGTLTGTIKYMAPEQITGDPIDARTDVFAAGVMLYEMVAGHPPFDAPTALEWLNAVLREDPPATGVAEAVHLEPVMQRALQRRPEDRYPSASSLAADLEAVRDGMSAASSPARETAGPGGAVRLVVLPFRMLKPDEEIAFLENGLPEALTASLSSAPSLSVRSNLAALKFEETDFPALASELDVDRVIAGTLLRSGDQVRVTAQLVETPGGVVRWSETFQQPLAEPFALQDELCRQIMQALPIETGGASAPPEPSDASPQAGAPRTD